MKFVTATLALFFALTSGGIVTPALSLSEDAVASVKQHAEEGNVTSQFILGGMYYSGSGVSQDYKESAKWFQLAAEQGDADAQYQLGRLYYLGEGVSQDYKESAKWFQLAAEQGDANAQYQLGQLYYFGEGVVKSYKEAARWYKLAAEQGLAKAQISLGGMYMGGHGVPQNYREGYIWFSIAGTNYEDGLIELRQIAEKQLTSIERNQAQDEALRRMRQIETAQKQQ